MRKKTTLVLLFMALASIAVWQTALAATPSAAVAQTAVVSINNPSAVTVVTDGALWRVDASPSNGNSCQGGQATLVFYNTYCAASV